MKISQYIKELLFDFDCVIIPGFGAFVASYETAQLDEGQEELLPPSKTISFDRKLKNNDGLLVNYMAKSEGISDFDSLKKIEEFRENIQYKLEKGEKIEFKGLGTLSLNDNNNTEFKSDSDENFLLESFGLDNTSLKTFKGKIENNKPVMTIKKNKVGILILIISVVISAVFIYLNYFPPKSGEDVSEEIKTVVIDTATMFKNTIKDDSAQIKLQMDSLNSVIPEIEKDVEEIISEEKYYLIGGSFKEKQNADKYFNKISQWGYQPHHLGKQGSFYIVALGVYNSLHVADSVKNEFLNKEPDSGVWVKKIED